MRVYYETNSQVEDRIIDAVMEKIGSTPQTDGMYRDAKNAAKDAAKNAAVYATKAAKNAAASATAALETRKNNQADEKVRIKKAAGKARVVARDAKHKQQRRE
jgi:hypothetical protein